MMTTTQYSVQKMPYSKMWDVRALDVGAWNDRPVATFKTEHEAQAAIRIIKGV